MTDKTRMTRRLALAGLTGAAITAVSARTAVAQFQDVSDTGEARPAGAAPARYIALALQTVCDAVNQDTSVDAARARMRASLDRIATQIATSKGFLRTFAGLDAKLIVLPEYYLTGFPLRESPAEWKAKAAVDPDGPEYDALRAIAQRSGVYLAGNLYETDPAFPDLYFQVSSIISPSGDTILRYRRMVSFSTPTPYDVWDAFLDHYGYDAVFPVVNTDIGRLGSVASEEVLYPEITRMLALKGVEVITHSTSEVGAPGLTPKDIAKRARAIEAMAYVVSANSAEILGAGFPSASTDAMSKVVDWNGKVIGEAQSGESMNANAVIDLDELRETRARVGMSNVLARQPYPAFAPAYAEAMALEPNTMESQAPLDRAGLIDRQRAAIARLAATSP